MLIVICYCLEMKVILFNIIQLHTYYEAKAILIQHSLNNLTILTDSIAQKIKISPVK